MARAKRRRRRADDAEGDSSSEGSSAAPAARRARTGRAVNLVVQPGLTVVTVDSAPAAAAAATASAAPAPAVVGLEIDGLEIDVLAPESPPPPTVNRDAPCIHFRDGHCDQGARCRFRH